jgi:UDP-N-acetylmuramyl pentapeptide phosphotransferase/UDP-N-acetylglucosamine-1-phosphate transferase
VIPFEISSAIAGMLVGAAGAWWMLRRAQRGELPVDVPDERRLHSVPTPRGGGIGIPVAGLLAAVLAAVAVGGDERLLVLLAAAFALANGAMGALDDYRPMRTPPKLAFQAVCAAAVVACGLRVEVIAVPPLGVLELGTLGGSVFSVLWLVWLANVFNFMDGMDALAAGCGTLFCAGLVGVALAGDAHGVAILALGLGGGLVGFLRYNAPPAKIFMGDGGSLFAGAALGGLALALALPEGGGAPIAVPALVMGPFVFDATFTVVRRLLRGDPMKPHRTHLYQRLALAGWSHGAVRALFFGLTAVCAASALALVHGPRWSHGLWLALGLGGCAALVALVARAERQRT